MPRDCPAAWLTSHLSFPWSHRASPKTTTLLSPALPDFPYLAPSPSPFPPPPSVSHFSGRTSETGSPNRRLQDIKHTAGASCCKSQQFGRAESQPLSAWPATTLNSLLVLPALRILPSRVHHLQPPCPPTISPTSASCGGRQPGCISLPRQHARSLQPRVPPSDASVGGRLAVLWVSGWHGE